MVMNNLSSTEFMLKQGKGLVVDTTSYVEKDKT